MCYLLTTPSKNFLLPGILVTLTQQLKDFVSFPHMELERVNELHVYHPFCFLSASWPFQVSLYCISASWQIVSAFQTEASVHLALRNNHKFYSVGNRGQDNPVEI